MVLWILIGIPLAVLLAAAVLLVYHTIHLTRERAAYPPPGILFDVQRDTMHLYTQGTRSPVLVFLAGSGTSSPVLDFRVLYEQVSDEFTIAIPERPGYGWSEHGSNPRDIPTMLNQTRSILDQAGFKPPFVVIAHSMAALEALSWVKLYPGEVIAVIGIDPAVPEAYGHLRLPSGLLQALLAAGGRIGITRFMPGTCRAPLANPSDRAAYCAMVHRNTLTSDMIREIRQVRENARFTADLGYPEVPLLFFDSGGSDTGLDTWSSMLASYIEASTEGTYVMLEGSHYIHHEHAQTLVQNIRSFLKSIE